jgi:uncharacterized protein involved in exopolysaccharide biosynthesis
MDELTVRDLSAWLRRHGVALLAVGLTGAAVGVLVATALPKVYRGDVVVMLLRDGDDASGMGGQLGGLAALAGVSLGDDGTDEALEVLRSRQLAARFIEQQNLLPELFPERLAASGEGWRDEAPSSSEAVDRFDRRVRTVSQEKSTGMVRLSMRSGDPQRAAELANRFVELANADMRARAADDAQRLLGFLKEEASLSPVLEVRQVLYRLAETQLKTLAMARVRQEFAYRVIDPAIAPHARAYVSPSRVAYGALGLIAGLALAVGIAMLRDSRGKGAPG